MTEFTKPIVIYIAGKPYTPPAGNLPRCVELFKLKHGRKPTRFELTTDIERVIRDAIKKGKQDGRNTHNIRSDLG